MKSGCPSSIAYNPPSDSPLTNRNKTPRAGGVFLPRQGIHFHITPPHVSHSLCGRMRPDADPRPNVEGRAQHRCSQESPQEMGIEGEIAEKRQIATEYECDMLNKLNAAFREDLKKLEIKKNDLILQGDKKNLRNYLPSWKTLHMFLETMRERK